MVFYEKKLLRIENRLVNFVASKMYNNFLVFHSLSDPDLAGTRELFCPQVDAFVVSALLTLLNPFP